MRELAMPSLGADMEEGTVLDWLVAPGDVVKRGDILAVVATEKADIDVEIFEDAVIDELLVTVGTKVPVGAPIARVHDSSVEPPRVVVEPAVTVHLPVVRPVAVLVASPVIRHLAERAGIDLGAVHGSGRGGRIVRDDVERLAGNGTPRPSITPRARRLARHLGVDLPALIATAPSNFVITGAVVSAQASTGAAARPAAAASPLPPMRRAIARVMARSWREIPHYHVGLRLDLDAAMRWLSGTNEARPASRRILPAALLLRATALAAVEVPEINGWWRDDTFVPAAGVDLAVAVALRTGGLLTPVISAADTKGLDATMSELRDIVNRARHGRLRASELRDASITVTNLGEQGADWITGVIHPPQVALVGFGAIRPEPVAVDGSVVVRPVVQATLAGDHRASDGRRGAELLSLIARLLQEPDHL